MLTMAILAIIGAFLFGFVLCAMFAVGAEADRSDRSKLDGRHDSIEVILLGAAIDPRPVRHPHTDAPVARRRGARGRLSSRA
jgi:hypothetical protein